MRALREARPLARSPDAPAEARRAHARPRGEEDAVPRGRAALARAVLQRAERDRSVRGAAQGRARRSEAREQLDELYLKRRAGRSSTRSTRSELETAEGRHAARAAERDGEARRRAARTAAPTPSRLYKQILDADPGASDVLDALEKQAERAKDWATLAEALERRARRSTDDAARLAVLQKLGAVYAEHLNDPAARGAHLAPRARAPARAPARAARAARVVSRRAATTTALEELYASQNDWEGLAEVLSTAADRAKDNATRRSSSRFRAARGLRGEARAPERAFRSYERDPRGRPERRARRRGALIPLYEKDEKWARLPPLYELLCRAAPTSDDRKLELLQQAGRGHRRAALAIARRRSATRARAYELAPDNRRARSCSRTRRAPRAAGARSSRRSRGGSDARRRASRRSRPEQARQEEEDGRGDDSRARRLPTRRRPSGARSSSSWRGSTPTSSVASTTRSRTTSELLERDPADDEAAAALEAHPAPRGPARRSALAARAARDERAERRGRGSALLSEWAALEEDVFERPRARRRRCYARVLELDPADERALARCRACCLRRATRPAPPRSSSSTATSCPASERAAARGRARGALPRARSTGPTTRSSRGRTRSSSPRQAARAMPCSSGCSAMPAVRARAAEVLAEQYATSGEARREAQALDGAARAARPPSGWRSTRLADVHEEKLGASAPRSTSCCARVREFPRELAALGPRRARWRGCAGRPTDLAEAYREVLQAELPARGRGSSSASAPRACTRTGSATRRRDAVPRARARARARQRARVRAAEGHPHRGRALGRARGALRSRVARDRRPARAQTEMLIEVALICEEIIEDARQGHPLLRAHPRRSIRSTTRRSARSIGCTAAQERHEELAALLEQAARDGERRGAARAQAAAGQASSSNACTSPTRPSTTSRTCCATAERLPTRGSWSSGCSNRQPARARGRACSRPSTRRATRSATWCACSRFGSSARRPTGGTDPELENERRELLRRIATLRDERLHDDQGALDALARAGAARPARHRGARSAASRSGAASRRTSGWPRCSRKAAERAETPGLKGEILMQVARDLRGLLADGSAPKHVYRRVLELDPERRRSSCCRPARALERIYVGSGATTPSSREMLGIRSSSRDDARRGASSSPASASSARRVLGRHGQRDCKPGARARGEPRRTNARSPRSIACTSDRHGAIWSTVIERRRDISERR